MASSHGQQTRVGFIGTVDLNGADGKTRLSVGNNHALTESKSDFKSFLLGGPKFDDFETERELDYGREIDL